LLQAIVGGIMFTMSNWVYPGRYIGYMIPEAFATTAINMVCAYIAASIPYANGGITRFAVCCLMHFSHILPPPATFTVNFYFCLMIGGFYITDQALFLRHPTVRTFWQWFSWARMLYLPMMRDECVGQPLFCLDRERVPFDTTGINVRGLGGAAKNLTIQAGANNPTLVQALNTFDIWENAGAEVNATVSSLYRTARALNSVQLASGQAVVAGNPASTLDNLATMTAVARAAFGAAVNIPVSDNDRLQASLNDTLKAASFLGFADYLVANPVPMTFTCTSANGEAYVAGPLGFECELCG
jgi:hypothetical protein